MGYLIISGLILISCIIGATSFASSEKTGMGGWFFCFFLFFIPLFGGWTLANSIAYTDLCDRKVMIWLREPYRGYVSNGFQWVNPIVTTETYNVCRQELIFTGDETLRGTAKGGTEMIVMDAVIPYRIRPENLWRVIGTVGDKEKLDALLTGSARSAARATQANFEWRDIVYERRDDFEVSFSSQLKERLTRDLMGAGLTQEEAVTVFEIPEVRLRSAKPTQSVLDEQGNLEQARVQQETADVRIVTAQKDGEGINAFFTSLDLKPANISEAATFMAAFADLERARALARISGDDKKEVSVMVLSGGGSPAINLPNKIR